MLTISVRGADSLQQLLRRASGQQMRQAAAAALNDLGFAVQKEMRAQIAGAFNQPTAFIARSPKVKKADDKTLTVRVWPTLNTEGTPPKWTPQMTLAAQEAGGARTDKRSEVALRAMGLLPDGLQTALPRRPYPGSVKGNDLSGAFVRRVLRALKRSGQGMGPHRVQRRKGRARQHGEQFFVLRQRRGRLAPGVYGLNSGRVAAVLLFVQRGSYSARIDKADVLRAVDAPALFADKMQRRLRRIFEGGAR